MADIVLDSLIANEFEVHVDGQKVQGVFRVSGLTLFRPAGDALLVITKMVQRDPKLSLNQWMRDTLESVGKVPTRSVSVTAVDDGVPVRRWEFSDSHIQAVTYSDFDSGSNEMVEERIAIHYTAISHKWLVE